MKKALPKSKPKAGPTLSAEKILNWYMEDVLEDRKPKSVYMFSKEHGFGESEFYKYYSGFEAIEKQFFAILFEKTRETMVRSSEYLGYDAKEKLLSFYYTYFGNLTINRSFVMHLLSDGKLESLRKLQSLRKLFKGFVSTLGVETIDMKSRQLNHLQEKALEESAWFQFLTILKFWQRDSSPGFEKTDVMIEKSVTAGFDLVNTSPIRSVADLGKFLYKEFKPAM